MISNYDRIFSIERPDLIEHFVKNIAVLFCLWDIGWRVLSFNDTGTSLRHVRCTVAKSTVAASRRRSKRATARNCARQKWGIGSGGGFPFDPRFDSEDPTVSLPHCLSSALRRPASNPPNFRGPLLRPVNTVITDRSAAPRGVARNDQPPVAVLPTHGNAHRSADRSTLSWFHSRTFGNLDDYYIDRRSSKRRDYAALPATTSFPSLFYRRTVTRAARRTDLLYHDFAAAHLVI